MSALKRSWLLGIGTLCILGAAAAAPAQQTRSGTDRPGSILMFPKVVRSASRDTIVQITNTGNSINWVHCFYLSAPDGSGYCGATDFELVLTRQQPTQWRVSQGRRVDPSDAFGAPGAGFDAGLIPPVPPGFRGSLVCVEVDANGDPLAQNRLKGEVTILDDSNGDVAKYNAFALAARGLSVNNPLNLDDSEYERCPNQLTLNFSPRGSLDPVIEDLGNASLNSFISTNLTLLSCNVDLQAGVRSNGIVSFVVYDEFESPFSGVFPYQCWSSIDLGNTPQTTGQFRSTLLSGGAINTIFAQARLVVSGAGAVAVAESAHADQAGRVGTAASNLHTGGGAVGIIRLP
ncbi:MAG: hypothetical protein N3C12_06120 [Candidatus Binatia bacterium]|nr:hypothetical protein [Candidatus Binatia bacterium]